MVVHRLRLTLVLDWGDVLVKRDAFGARVAMQVVDCDVAVTFPKSETDFLTWSPPQPFYRALTFPASGMRTPDAMLDVSRADAATARYVQATVDFDFSEEITSDPPEAIPFPPDFVTRLHQAAYAANDAVLRLRAWAQAEGPQPWVGISGERISQVGPSQLIDLASGQPVKFAVSLHSGARARGPEGVLALDDLRSFASRVEGGESPPIWDTLLSDAEHLLIQSVGELIYGIGFETWGANPSRAILMAAIACETKAKQRVQELASEEQAPLVSYVLTNHREVAVTAADGLFNSLMGLVAGRSLKDSDRELWKGVERLFQTRNHIAHRGNVASLEDAKALVSAARQATNWLDDKS